MAVAPHRLLADTWVRIDPETIDDRNPRSRRLAKGDILTNLTEDEIEYLTHGVRPSLVEADSDADPYKDDPEYAHLKDDAPVADAKTAKSSSAAASA